MTSGTQPDPQKQKKSSSASTFTRMFRYTGVRLVTLFATVVVGVYLTIMIANMGGYVDQIMRSEIRERVTIAIGANPANRALTADARKKLVDDTIALEEKRLGLDTPVVVRSLNYLATRCA